MSVADSLGIRMYLNLVWVYKRYHSMILVQREKKILYD
jgi:hypothetical protein